MMLVSGVKTSNCIHWCKKPVDRLVEPQFRKQSGTLGSIRQTEACRDEGRSSYDETESSYESNA